MIVLYVSVAVGRLRRCSHLSAVAAPLPVAAVARAGTLLAVVRSRGDRSLLDCLLTSLLAPRLPCVFF
jgi:hypothetical protein